MRRVSIVIALMLIGSLSLTAAEKRPMTPEDLFEIKRVGDPQISADGNWLAYTVSVPIVDEDRFNSDIWLLSLKTGQQKQLTFSTENEYEPRWHPQGDRIAFLSDREGVNNLYVININGGEAQKITAAETSLYAPLWSKDGAFLVCGSRVVPPGKAPQENWTGKRLPLSTARTIDNLLFRQWNRWLSDKRNHLFKIDPADGAMTDLTPADFDVPPVSLAGSDDFDLSPDGSELCYVKNIDSILAVSTNHDLFLLDLQNMQERKLTQNPAYDSNPHYSPDGRYIAYTAMEKVGYESDREVLTLYDRQNGNLTRLTEGLDRSVREIVWHPGSNALFFTARDEGRVSIFRVDLKGNVKRLSHDGYNTGLQVTPDGKELIFSRSYNHQPAELFSMSAKGGDARQLTFVNKTLTAELDLSKLEDFWFEGAEGTKVHGFIQRPPDFDPDKKYPVILTIHGGPQGMWADRFMTTWFNFQLVSARGYVGVFINPRGSEGYGSRFREQVSRDYGGRVYEDLMRGLDYAIENYDFIDAEKQAAIGGSFGGYSVNWIMGQTDRFDCIVSHAGLYNLISFYGATEELWFPAWDMGETPWDEPELYEKWSPHNYARNFSTPTLVTHGDLDFRVPFAESLQLFTALQRQGIPSRLVVFHDEGHVISGLQNNVRWWIEMQRWFGRYLK